MLGGLLVLLVLVLPTWGTTCQAARRSLSAPSGFRAIALPHGVLKVWDGDTFDADLNGDGRLELPAERVRLLYVDTPELHASPKGKDLAHGLPARAFLVRALQRRPLLLYVPLARPRGEYGRTLARVLAGGRDVNLALIRAGHSYFDTRFAFPPAPEFALYAAAEGAAFDARRGIWADAASRHHYLERLRREHKTPAGRRNPLYWRAWQDARRFDAHAALGRYVRVRAVVATLHTLRDGLCLLTLQAAHGRRDLVVVAYPSTAARLGVRHWRPGTRVRMEGFVERYNDRPELVLHYGTARR